MQALERSQMPAVSAASPVDPGIKDWGFTVSALGLSVRLGARAIAFFLCFRFGNSVLPELTLF